MILQSQTDFERVDGLTDGRTNTVFIGRSLSTAFTLQSHVTIW